MINKKQAKFGVSILALAGAPFLSPTVSAFDYSVSGFIRQEMAYKINSDQNPQNPNGDPANGSSVTNLAPLDPRSCSLINVLAGGTPGAGACSMGLIPPTFDKPKLEQESDWNVFATRAEIDVNINFTNNLSGVVKVRGYYQPDVFDDYGDPNLFSVNNHGNEATYLSISDDDYMIDLPSLYLDYAKGPLWVRVGNQQIAWGEALFFRVADVANGLDLRRHLFLDFGAEEYADERLSAPGVRASYILTEGWELEVFAQMFQPTVLPNRGSPYNLTPYPLTIDFEPGYDKVDDQINGGIRLQGQVGNLGMQFFAVSRHNPDPIFRLTPGGLSMPGTALEGPLGPSGLTVGTQPFTQDWTGEFGLNSWSDWFASTGLAGLDGLQVLNSLVDEWGYLTDAFTVFSYFGLTDAPGDPHVSTKIQGDLIVDTLVTAFGAPLQAGAEAIYASENVFGLGFNYIFYADPGSLLDQLVVRFEASYTPDKKFTATGVSRSFIEEDEWVTSLVFEKYHRFSDTFPATFFIFEWMHKSESDMLGRHLSGLGGDANHLPGGGEDGRGWDGLVFALQQPFPNLTWRADLSVLYDLNGGMMIQPAVRYKPSGEWTIEAFANFIDAKDSASVFAPMEWSDDVTVRLTYQF
ncbi:hypothetical protein A9Q88_13835 [Gammaproteobacteria bacterium 50_400_T64]|nr:hypothetical protein A9Q88_13835 [Gammaproteobacteria bacterium 50_400_T64]